MKKPNRQPSDKRRVQTEQHAQAFATFVTPKLDSAVVMLTEP